MGIQCRMVQATRTGVGSNTKPPPELFDFFIYLNLCLEIQFLKKNIIQY